MKKLASIVMIVVLLGAGCSSQQEPKAENKTKEVTPQVVDVKPVKLNKALFLDKIVDYENNPGQWIYKGDLPSVIDFYADWCRPCRITSPIMDELAQEYNGKIKFYKIDIQAEQELAAVFGIQSIPAFLFIPKNDKPVMSAGIAATPELTKQMFREQIDKILLNKTN